jgi:hypothetical protein
MISFILMDRSNTPLGATRFIPAFLVVLLAMLVLPHSAYAYAPYEIIPMGYSGAPGYGNDVTCGGSDAAATYVNSPGFPVPPGGWTSYVFTAFQEAGAPADALIHPQDWCYDAWEEHTTQGGGGDTIGDNAWEYVPSGAGPSNIVPYYSNRGPIMYAKAYTYSVQACTVSNACNTGSASGYIIGNNYGTSNAPGPVGSCDATPPPNPSGYGNACSSSANACGQTSSGTIQCNGSCSASPPSNPPNYGTSCTSAPNSCGQTNTGTYQCDGSCSATTPSNASCAADLTVLPAANATTTLGSSIPLSGTVENIGGVSTGAGFNNIFVTNLNSSQTDWNTKQVVPINNALAGGASQGISTTLPGTTFSSIGNYSWAYCANRDANWASTISESNQNNNCSARGTIAVTAPDLTAADVTPSVATTSVSTKLSGQVSNIGNASTGTGFTDLFEINQNSIPSSFSQIKVLRAYTSAKLVAGAHNTATASYTFPSSGTWYVRLCADMNTSGAGSITESNENNNCSPDWVGITVTSPLAGSCTVAPSSGTVGTPFTWTVSNVTGGTGSYSYSWSGDEGLSGTGTSVTKTYTTPGAKNGSVTVTSGTRSATFNCTTSTGVQSCSNGSCVYVYPPPTVSCSANPTTIDIGQSTTLTWSSTNANSCKFADESASRGTSGTRSVTPSQSPTSTYAVTCTGSGGGTTQPCYANISVIVPSCTISATPNRVKSGDTATLTWSTANVTGCSVKDSSGVVLSNSCNGGPLTTARITSQQMYTITCATMGPAITDSAIINILTVFQQF